jgi:allantoate deiminase
MVTGGARAVARCDELGVAPYSDAEGMLFRAYLTPAHSAALEKVAEWMRGAGMSVRTDAAANLIGRYEGWRELPPLIIGSHIDSVRDGGKYDGPLGIMLGIEAVATLSYTGKRPPFPIEIYAFGDEEGSRFPASMLTSRVVAGILGETELDITDRDGVALTDALAGFKHPPSSFALDAKGDYLSAAHGPALAYFEAHIEQGPVLEAEGLAVGVVTGIASQLRYQLTVIGMAGHAGTTTMPLRKDALAAAAEMVLAAELSASLAAIGQPEFRLPSGAGHDAMNLAALCPTAMLFLRCRGGISHNPAEHVEPADAEIALKAMLGFIERLGESL